MCACVRVFADPLRDGGRRQKSQEWEGEREHERVGAERERASERERDDGKVARATENDGC